MSETQAQSAARAITITRVFDAPRELVWQAWTQPGQLAQWWGKRGWNTPLSSVTMDVRAGGAFSWTSISEEDGEQMASQGMFLEVVEPELLVFAQSHDAGVVDGTLASVTFADLGDGRTEMVFHTTVQMSAQTYDRARAGMSSAFDRLAEVIGG